MTKYQIFVIAFIVSIVASIIMIVGYVNFFSSMISNIQHFEEEVNQNPAYFFNTFFSPTMMISMIVASIAALVYIILGIVFVVQKPGVSSGEMILWIIGFLFFGFITAIVFMIVKDSRNLVPPYREKMVNQ